METGTNQQSPETPETPVNTDDKPRRKPGPRPGVRHVGQFRKGHSPHRYRQPTAERNRDLTKLARTKTKKAFRAIMDVLEDERTRPADKLRAAEMVLDRGHGKAVNSLQINDISDPAKAMASLPLDELKARVAALLLEHDSNQADSNAIEGEIVTPNEGGSGEQGEI
jgi:hypothetical protein